MNIDKRGPEVNADVNAGDSIGPFTATYPSSIADATIEAVIIDPRTGTTYPAQIQDVNLSTNQYTILWVAAPPPGRYEWYHRVTIGGLRRTWWRGVLTVVAGGGA